MVAGLLAFATTTVSSQTSSSKTTKTTPSATTETTPKTAAQKFRGRLPNNYGKLGLSAQQRDLIYAIQAKHHAEIEELEARLAAIKVQQADEIQAVLTPEQKTGLEGLNGKKKAIAKKTEPGS